jgi:hypothetical protein
MKRIEQFPGFFYLRAASRGLLDAEIRRSWSELANEFIERHFCREHL